jgi:cell division protein FtsN
LTLEHPAGPSRARADYWTARVLFEKNDAQHACAATADALTHASADDTELRNQITYLNQRCAGVVIAAAPSNTPVSDSIAGAAKVASSGSASGSAANTGGVDSPIVRPQVKQTTTNTPTPRMPPPSTPRDAKPSMVEPFDPNAPAGKPSSSKTTVTKPTGSNAGKPVTTEPAAETDEGAGYSVQVAAYNVKKQAQAMVTKLKARGYEARVSGSGAPFRVRIGHYATEAQAEAVKRSLKAKKIDGFVVKAE